MIKVGKSKIGDGNPCFITFELGATHTGYDSAKRLIYKAAKSGADAVKFQIFDPEKLISDKKQLFSYEVLINKKKNLTKKITEPLYDILKKRTLSKKQWISLKKICDKLNIAFFSTVGFEDEVDFLKKIGCQSIKISSADINHISLLRHAAKTKLLIQIDTGMASIDEIKKAVNVIVKEGNKKIIIHHCPTDYPARLDKVNLNIIKTLKKTFDFPIAYSDHTPGINMDIAALTLGVNLIEKTVTENRATRSVEHIMSIEIDEMKDFVKSLRDIEKGMGNFDKSISKKEKVSRDLVRRSAFLDEDCKKGKKLNDCKIIFRRPGTGIQSDEFENIKKNRLKRNLLKGHLLIRNDIV
jgi:N,N'-diacetyllegionaminate synthase